MNSDVIYEIYELFTFKVVHLSRVYDLYAKNDCTTEINQSITRFISNI